ncbi:MAG: HAD family phosphatase [Pseudomonadota bacterium]
MGDRPGLLFDMDGLLLDTEQIGLAAFQEVLADYDVADTEAQRVYQHLVGGSNATTETRLARHFPQIDPKTLQTRWVGAFETRIARGVPAKPTVTATIHALHAQGYAMAVVTSSSRVHAEHNLAAAGLLELFQGIVPGDEVARAKPDPLPYEQGAALLGRAAAQCVAFEDSDPGVHAATAAGCRTFQIPDIRPPDKPLPELGQTVAQTLADAVAQAGLLAPASDQTAFCPL